MGNLSNTPKQVNPATASTLFTRPKETGHGKVFNSNIQCVYCSQAHYSASCEQVKDNTERKTFCYETVAVSGALKLVTARKIAEYVATAAIAALDIISPFARGINNHKQRTIVLLRAVLPVNQVEQKNKLI